MALEIIQYARKNLEPGEKIIYQTRTHWIVLAYPALMVIGAMAIHLWSSYHGLTAPPGGLAAIPELVMGDTANTLPILAMFLASSAVKGYLALVGIIMLTSRVITLISSEMTVTTRRVIDKEGLFWRDANEIPASRLEGSRLIAQSWLGQVLDYGTLELSGVGGKPLKLPYAVSPLTLRRHVSRLIAAHEKRSTRQTKSTP